MRRNCTDPLPTTAIPTIKDMLRVWRADRCVQESTASNYLQWIMRFRAYCGECHLDEHAELTRNGARRFVAWYAHRHNTASGRLSGAQTALYALSRVYQVMGLVLPAWQAPPHVKPPASVLLRAYADHLARYHGNPEATIRKKLAHIGKLLQYIEQQGKTWRTMKLHLIDAFLVECSLRYARSTTADMASSVRCFARFLLVTGRIRVDLAEAVISPVQPKYERPPRALPWEDVQRLLRAVDTSTARGKRDHALLLLMSTYGLGAGEVIRLQLQDIDWHAGTLKVFRPKTGVTFSLPLLPPVAKVLANYLQHGRPPSTPTRHLFVRMKMPFGRLCASGAVRHILVKHAGVAGLDAPYLGSHVLRHSNAARQIAVGTPPRVLSDLLGHRDPESVSAYLRIATESLREVSLPVPT